MVIILLVLLPALVLGGVGFLAYWLWSIAAVVLVLWLVGFLNGRRLRQDNRKGPVQRTVRVLDRFLDLLSHL